MRVHRAIAVAGLFWLAGCSDSADLVVGLSQDPRAIPFPFRAPFEGWDLAVPIRVEERSGIAATLVRVRITATDLGTGQSWPESTLQRPDLVELGAAAVDARGVVEFRVVVPRVERPPTGPVRVEVEVSVADENGHELTARFAGERPLTIGLG